MNEQKSTISDDEPAPIPEMPGSIKMLRMAVWTQVALAGCIGSLVGTATLSLGQLSTEERIEEGIDPDVSETYGWAWASIMVALCIALAFCAVRLATASKRLRYIALTVEFVAIVFTLFDQMSGPNPITLPMLLLSCAVLVLLWRNEAKMWFTR